MKNAIFTIKKRLDRIVIALINSLINVIKELLNKLINKKKDFKCYLKIKEGYFQKKLKKIKIMESILFFF